MSLAHGKAIKQGRAKEPPAEKRSDNCPIQKDAKFPDSVNVSIGITHEDSVTQMPPQDVSNRSTSPWDYRYHTYFH